MRVILSKIFFLSPLKAFHIVKREMKSQPTQQPGSSAGATGEVSHVEKRQRKGPDQYLSCMKMFLLLISYCFFGRNQSSSDSDSSDSFSSDNPDYVEYKVSRYS
jgi:hypothetical protein